MMKFLKLVQLQTMFSCKDAKMFLRSGQLKNATREYHSVQMTLSFPRAIVGVGPPMEY